MKSIYLLILLLSLSLIVDDVNAFWKNKNKVKEDAVADEVLSSSTTTTTTTAAPSTTASLYSRLKFWKKKKDEPSSTASPSSTTLRIVPTPKHGPTAAPSANKGIASAADPALAIGVGSTGGKIHEDARNQPHKPNPGTEVGLDIGLPKPGRPGVGGAGAGGYRNWAADLTGAGDPGRPRPKLPAEGPALTSTGNRPASVPGTPLTQQSTPAPGPKAASSIPSSQSGQPTINNAELNGKASVPVQPTATTKSIARPALSTTAAPVALPNKPTNTPVSSPKPTVAPVSPSTAKPTGIRSWAEVAGGGISRPNSPTPAARPGSATPVKSGQAPFEYPQAGNKAAQPTRPGVSPGTAAVAASGAALAGGAAIGAAAAAADHDKTYSNNPIYSKGKDVTDEDLEKLSEALFIKDVNNAIKYITLNLQKQTSSSNSKDEAPEPLLTVKAEAFEIPTVQRVLAIHDNYKLDTRENEYISPAQRKEESLLVDTFLSTNVMSTAMRFLADKNLIKKDYYEYKDALRTLWFNLYSRGEGKIGSTGFEHVFLTELKLGNEVSGLHNWIYFNAEELKKRLDYLGYIKKVDLGNKAAIVKVHLKYNGIDKPVSNVFIGTSPELEMALYTVCFYARPEASCPVSLGGTKFNIITHKFKYRGKEHIGSAYPEI